MPSQPLGTYVLGGPHVYPFIVTAVHQTCDADGGRVWEVEAIPFSDALCSTGPLTWTYAVVSSHPPMSVGDEVMVDCAGEMDEYDEDEW